MTFVIVTHILSSLYIILLFAVKVAGTKNVFCAVNTGEFTELQPMNFTDGTCPYGFPIVNTPEATLEMQAAWARFCFIMQFAISAYILSLAFFLLERVWIFRTRATRPFHMDHNVINNVMVNFAVNAQHNTDEQDSDTASEAPTEIATFQAGSQTAVRAGVSHEGLYSVMGIECSQTAAIANDIGLLLLGLLSSNGSRLQIASHWMSFANVFSTRGIRMPNFSDFKPDLISLLLSRASVSHDEEVAIAQAGFPDPANIFKTLSSVFKSDISHRFVGLLSLLTAIMFYFDAGKGFSVTKFIEIEREYRKKYFSETNDFFASATQTIDFFLTRGRMWYNGDLTGAFSLATPYTQFMTKYAGLACDDGYMIMERSWTKKRAHLSAIRNLRDEGKSLIHMVPKEQVKDVVQANNRIAEMLTTHDVRMKSGGMKYAPYAIMLQGKSGQAKSVILGYIMKWASDVLKISKDDYEAVNWANLSDKFDETYYNQWVDIHDDAAIQTGKPGELDPVVDAIIRRVNNATHLVPKAFGDKGKVAYTSQLLIVTTNNPELNLRETAHCPMAVFRRMKANVVVELKPEFTKADGTLNPAKALNKEGDVVDMWKFTLLAPVESDKGDRMPDFKTVKIFTQTKDFLNFLAHDIAEHDKNQNDLLAGVSTISNITFCPTCKANGLLVPQTSCLCSELAGAVPSDDIPDGVPVGESAREVTTAQAMTEFLPRVGSLELYRLVTSAEFRKVYLQRVFIGCFFHGLQECHSMAVHWLNWAILWVANCLDLALYFPVYLIVKMRQRGTQASNGFREFCSSYGPSNYVATRLLLAFTEWWMGVVRQLLLRFAGYFLNPAAEQRMQMAIAGTTTDSLFSWFTTERATRTMALLAIATGMYACIKRVGSIQGIFQSGSSSEDEQEKVTINGPDPLGRNPYYRPPEVVPMPTQSSRAMSNSQDPKLKRIVERNIFFCSIRALDPTATNPKVVNCNAVKIKYGRMLVPNHAIPEKGPILVTLRSTGKLADGSRSFEYQQSQITRMPEKDLAMFDCNIRVNNGSSDLDQFFLTGAPFKGKAKAVTYVRRYQPSEEGDSYKLVEIEYHPLAEAIERRFAMKQIAEGYPAPNQPCHYFGGVPSIPTIDGDCGGVTVGFLGHNEAPVIFGLHALQVEKVSLFGFKPASDRPNDSYSAVILAEDLQKLHTMHSSRPTFQGDFRVLPLDFLPDLHSCVKKTPLEYTDKVHPKCALGYFGELKDAPTEDRPCCEIAGTLNHHRRKAKTSIIASPISDYLAQEHGIKSEKVPPPKKPEWIAQRLHIQGVSTENKAYQPAHLVSAAGGAYANQISKILPDSLEVLTNEQAVNGIPGTPYVDAVNGSSSGGIGLEGPKRNYYDPDAERIEIQENGQAQVKVKFVQEIYDEVEEYTSAYRMGHRRPAIFVAVDKDELLSAKKAQEGKIRQIFTSPLPYTILVRKYLMTFIAFMQTHREQTEVAVGLNAMGPQWGALREYLTTFGENTCFDGDFKGFDKSVVAGRILSEVLAIIYRLVAPRLPTDDDRIILSGILSEMTDPLFDFHGTLVTFNMNPSGNPITVIINCIANSIVARMVWATLHPSVGLLEAITVMYDEPDDEKRFRYQCEILMEVYIKDPQCFTDALSSYRSHVHQINYGDDNGYNVSEDTPWFNHTTFAAAASIYRIEYTHADKTDPRLSRVPYKHIDEISFLKRSFRKDPVTGLVMAPLEKASFSNMLGWNRKHNLKSQEALTASSLESWILESVQHGREYYDEVQKIVADVASKFPGIGHHLTKVPGAELYFKTYEEVLEMSYGYCPKA